MIESEQKIFALTSRAGVRRDGTDLDNTFYRSAQWVRFQRGRPRKMGGYRLMSDMVSGPVRELYVDARDPVNSAHTFSRSGIEKLAFDQDGVGGGVAVRTPAAFVGNAAYSWQAASLYDAGGSGTAFLIASATPDIDNIANDTAGPVYYGDITGTGVLVPLADSVGNITVSGGCCVIQPFLFVFGSNGYIRNSEPNDISSVSGWSGAFSNAANVAGTKIVRGLPTRGGGNSPAGLFWALDSLIRVSFVNDGSTIWRYDPVSASISVLSKSGIIEHDNVYYWPGVDRFYAYNGVVQELPNDMNQNFFFDELNVSQRNKVWATKVPRFGEIWWFFPRGDSVECNHAIIYNVREQTWYDVALERSAGAAAQVYTRPILAGGDVRDTTLLTLTAVVGAFVVGETITGGTSGAVGTVVRPLTGALNVQVVSGTFVNAEGITGSNGGTATINAVPLSQQLDSVWEHERGKNRIYKQDETAIRATFETTQFQWMSGGPAAESPAGANFQTRIVRLEPDFVMSGAMSVRVNGRSFAQGPELLSAPFAFDGTTKFIDMREQRRELSFVFESNALGGDFQMGRIFLTAEPGDVRG